MRRVRYSAISRARASLSTTTQLSPAIGVPFRPRISTGWPGPADCRVLPRSSSNARTRPLSAPMTKISPCFKVPRCTSNVATDPLPRSTFDSTTTPSAGRSGLAFNSRSSACNMMASSSLSRPIPVCAETSTHKTSPPKSSVMISCCNKSLLTRAGSAAGLSHLLIATIVGHPAALAWLMASMVCIMTESSAATTRTTISVIFAPRDRISVKASWPGVSMNVITLSATVVI